jgi:hypothetical protein
MDEQIQECLRNLLQGEAYEDVITDELEDLRVRSFEEDGVLTNDKGLVITLADGSEYQLTIVQSR